MRSSSRNGFVRNSTAPDFMARTLIGLVPCPVMKMIGIGASSASRTPTRSSPLASGSCTSRIRQVGSFVRRWPRNSAADANVSHRRPTDRMRLRNASRTDRSSSTTYTIGPSVAITLSAPSICGVSSSASSLVSGSITRVLVQDEVRKPRDPAPAFLPRTWYDETAQSGNAEHSRRGITSLHAPGAHAAKRALRLRERQARRGGTMMRTPLTTLHLDSSDFCVTRVGFGAWAIDGSGWAFGWGPQEHSDSIAAIRHALDLGVDWIDATAFKGLGDSEEPDAELCNLSPDDRPYVFTKCGLIFDEGARTGEPRRSRWPASIRQECEASLRRLGVERIDLYHLHWPEETDTRVEDSLNATMPTFAGHRTGVVWYSPRQADLLTETLSRAPTTAS